MAVKDAERTLPLGDVVAGYECGFWPVKKFFWSRVKKAVSLGKLTDEMSVLDLGCGNAYLFREIRRQGKKCRLVGADINENIRKLKIPGCKFKVIGCGTKLPFGKDSFDAVFALDSMEHIENAKKAIGQIKNVLKPGGTLIITVPTENLFYRFCRFVTYGTLDRGEGMGTHYHTAKSLDQDIRNAGFVREKRASLPLFAPFNLVLAIRYRIYKK